MNANIERTARMPAASRAARDFSPTLRTWIDSETVKRDQLALIAGIHGTHTMHRLYWGPRYTGNNQPRNEWLRAWADSLALPPSFRIACKTELDARAQDFGFCNAGRDALEGINLDANADGRADWRDAPVWDGRKQLKAAERRIATDRALADGRVDPDELAAIDKAANEEQVFALAESRVLHMEGGRR